MSREWIKVRFVDDFRNAWVRGFASIDGISESMVRELYLSDDDHDSFTKLEERISGQIGYVYHESGCDYFEQVDDDWAIPDTCFEVIEN